MPSGVRINKEIREKILRLYDVSPEAARRLAGQHGLGKDYAYQLAYARGRDHRHRANHQFKGEKQVMSRLESTRATMEECLKNFDPKDREREAREAIDRIAKREARQALLAKIGALSDEELFKIKIGEDDVTA
jgi:hypothetical protein